MRVILLVVTALFSSAAFAQSVVIKKVELAGELVIVHYDLDDSNPNNEYLINLYTSKDNYTTALTKVSGDVGMDIKPGVDKKITWKIRDEYGGYKGKLALEIRGKVYVPFVRLQEFDSKKTYKKGNSYQLKWKVGSANPINIELYKGGERVSGEINQPNNGSHTLFIPKHATKGGDYRLRFSDTRNPEEVVYSENFKVGAKIPLLLKVIPAAVIVGVLVVVLTKKDSGGDDPPGNNNGNNDKEIKLPNLPD
ncbi:MAG TPA: Ser-Thr-rich GPI-anchored membrane family protein [Cyclobacteriaceae bacterium]|nr:Ser-Thr-rich GPI-anchored membrane family protein [Cyclobacteriaceae bacterium]